MADIDEYEHKKKVLTKQELEKWVRENEPWRANILKELKGGKR